MNTTDLSEKFGGKRLNIKIVGIGVTYTKFEVPAPLSTHARVAHLFLTGQEIKVEDPRKAPWRLISFDPDACKLVVEPVVDL